MRDPRDIMLTMILKNLTNSPQMIAGHRVPARGVSEPIELDDRTILAVKSSGIFVILDTPDEPTDAFDQMTDDQLRELYEVVMEKKPHHKTGRAKLLEVARANG